MPTATDAAQKVCFQRKLSFATATADGFADTAVLTGNTEAEGHGLFVDERSIETCMALLMGKTLPAYLTHDGAWGDRLGKEIGLFSGFYRDGAKIKAKTFSFLDSFKKFEAQTHAKMVELAQKLPDQFGLSVVFSGKAVWQMSDGSEVDASMPMPEGAVRGVPSIRFVSMESADFVKSPAANPDGLFTAKVDAPSDGMTSETIALSAHTTALAAKDAEIKALSEKHATAIAALATEHKTALDKLTEEHKTALAAKDAELAKVNESHAAALAEAKQFDMRLAGAPALRVQLEKQAGSELPQAGATDQERWEQFEALKKKSPADAEAFRAKYLSRK